MLCKNGQSIELKKYLKNHTENKSSWQNVVLGIVIENYSDKNLEMLSHHQSEFNVIVNVNNRITQSCFLPLFSVTRFREIVRYPKEKTSKLLLFSFG